MSWTNVDSYTVLRDEDSLAAVTPDVAVAVSAAAVAAAPGRRGGRLPDELDGSGARRRPTSGRRTVRRSARTAVRTVRLPLRSGRWLRVVHVRRNETMRTQVLQMEQRVRRSGERSEQVLVT